MLKDIIIEGVDRLGKDSLIQGLQNRLGFFQVIHYEKPKLLKAYHINETEDPVRGALKSYQIESFYHMFRMMSHPGRYIMNRAHLGECVYAPRYRHYGGDYVFELERQHTDSGSKFTETTLLVLLTTSDFSFIQDDGLSFDFDKKEEEQEDFKHAFSKSTIKNKLMIDVSTKTPGAVRVGCYRPEEEILAQVIEAYNEQR